MIYYNPSDNDVLNQWIDYRPRTCFLMTQLGGKRPQDLINIIESTEVILDKRKIQLFDANSQITGKDFLIKIWKLSLSVPLGIAIVTKSMKPASIPNIFYEMGIMNTLGKETIVIKCKNFHIPSDFIRTEYIEYDSAFDNKLNNYLDRVFEFADYCITVADNTIAKPLLSLDYLRRAFLITGDSKIKKKAQALINKEKFDEHIMLMLKSSFKIKNTQSK